MSTNSYAWALKHVIPYIRFTTYYTDFPGKSFYSGYSVLKAGDIILTQDSKKLTGKLIPGEFAHAALCVSKNKKWETSEMTHEDYRLSTFFDICKESDRVVIIRCPDWDKEYIKKVVAKCKSFEGALYDAQFSLGVKALYCSELVYESDFEHRLTVNLEDLAGIGRPYISPDGLYKAQNASCVWDSDW
jgi:hypothetical protein